MARTKRRQAGEGGISEYQTSTGTKFLIKYNAIRPDGSTKVVLKRGFSSRREAANALRTEVRKAETGEWVDLSKQTLTSYLEEWIGAQRLAPSTKSSYKKNIRLHVDRHIGRTPLDRLTAMAIDTWMRKLEASGRADNKGGLSARTVGTAARIGDSSGQAAWVAIAGSIISHSMGVSRPRAVHGREDTRRGRRVGGE